MGGGNRRSYVCYLAVVAIDEDVAAVEVAVDDAGVVGVEVVEPLDDLARPLLERLDGDVAVSVAVLAEAPGGADLGDEVEDAGVAVQPHLVEADDVVVAERAEEAHLGVEALHHAGVAVGQRPQPDAVPRHLDPLLLVEPAVHLLDGPEPQHVRVPPEPPRRVHLLERLLAVHAVHRHGGGGSGFARARDAARRAADAAVRARVEGWGGAQEEEGKERTVAPAPIYSGEGGDSRGPWIGTRRLVGVERRGWAAAGVVQLLYNSVHQAEPGDPTARGRGHTSPGRILLRLYRGFDQTYLRARSCSGSFRYLVCFDCG